MIANCLVNMIYSQVAMSKLKSVQIRFSTYIPEQSSKTLYEKPEKLLNKKIQ